MPTTEETLKERGKAHGDYPEQALVAENIMYTIGKRREMSATQRHALYMIATKLARISVGNPHEPDHWRDIAGYATLVARELGAPSDES